MSAQLELLAPGLGVSIQDDGRRGRRAIGVPLSGALDPVFLAAANGLVGNPAAAAALEVLLAGPRLEAREAPVALALSGAMEATLITLRGTRRRLAAWSAFTLLPGETLQVGAPRGVGYVALAGGILTRPMLGSRSSYPRAGLGGIEGRALAAGGRLPCAPFPGAGLAREAPAFVHDSGPIRVIAGPQAENFTEQARHAFEALPFAPTAERDRMGMRLAGPPLRHREGGAEIVSDGVAPGAIQVPADGRAILLLADCQTVGGYPKIATVIQADLPRLAHLQPGDEIRFRAVSLAEAAAARTAQARRLADWLAALPPLKPAGELDSGTLLATNLAGAAIRGDEE